MAKVIDWKKIPLTQLAIGKNQVRKKATDLSELVSSIRKVGLLQPIMVHWDEDANKYEVILGQRRYHAYRQLWSDGDNSEYESIMASVVDVTGDDELELKILSLTENIAREGLSEPDAVDVCEELFLKYGSYDAVCDRTGLSQYHVKRYVRGAGLHPELKGEMLQGVKMDNLLRAQEAAKNNDGKVDVEDAKVFAKNFEGMTNAQKDRVGKVAANNPGIPPEEVIEAERNRKVDTRITMSLGPEQYGQLKAHANAREQSPEDAATALVLSGLGLEGG